jgi:hypothetical protein
MQPFLAVCPAYLLLLPRRNATSAIAANDLSSALSHVQKLDNAITGMELASGLQPALTQLQAVSLELKRGCQLHYHHLVVASLQQHHWPTASVSLAEKTSDSTLSLGACFQHCLQADGSLLEDTSKELARLLLSAFAVRVH